MNISQLSIGLLLMDKYFEETHCNPYEPGNDSRLTTQYISWLEARAYKTLNEEKTHIKESLDMLTHILLSETDDSFVHLLITNKHGKSYKLCVEVCSQGQGDDDIGVKVEKVRPTTGEVAAPNQIRIDDRAFSDHKVYLPIWYEFHAIPALDLPAVLP